MLSLLLLMVVDERNKKQAQKAERLAEMRLYAAEQVNPQSRSPLETLLSRLQNKQNAVLIPQEWQGRRGWKSQRGSVGLFYVLSSPESQHPASRYKLLDQAC